MNAIGAFRNLIPRFSFAHLHIGTSAHRVSLRFANLNICTFAHLAVLLLVSSCNPRENIINQGDYIDVDSTVLHWKEYIARDSFFREVTLNGQIVNIARCKSEQEFRDSTFTETDFWTPKQPKATRTFEKGIKTGVWTTWYEDGKTKSTSLVVNGVLRDYFSYYDNGSSAVTASEAPDGTMSRTERWRNGNLKEEFITDSLGNGTCTNYHENGKKSTSGQLRLFAPDSTWQRWDSLGVPMTDTTYGTNQEI